MKNRVLTFDKKWYQLAGQIIGGEQPKLEEIMIDIMSDYGAKEITLDDLTVGQIARWLVDCQEEIQPFIV